MKLVKTLVATAAVVASLGVNAAVTGSARRGLRHLPVAVRTGHAESRGTLSGAVSGTIVGGQVLVAVRPRSPMTCSPEPTTFRQVRSMRSPATLISHGAGVDYISFLWGIARPVQLADGQQHRFEPECSPRTASVSRRPTATRASISRCSSRHWPARRSRASCSRAPTTFESANFSITPIPEPETYALMLAGLGAMGFVARRRKNG